MIFFPVPYQEQGQYEKAGFKKHGRQGLVAAQLLEDRAVEQP